MQNEGIECRDYDWKGDGWIMRGCGLFGNLIMGYGWWKEWSVS